MLVLTSRLGGAGTLAVNCFTGAAALCPWLASIMHSDLSQSDLDQVMQKKRDPYKYRF